ncbi:MAG TPA: DUF4124 domain-containing protein [Burkholderiales bacterium]|nr:DUF4124 domain-containing protein [Burkholderiales bacterium]
MRPATKIDSTLRRSAAMASLAWLLLVFHGAPAQQQLYRSTMPDGRVIYGDQPVQGAVQVEQTKPPVAKKGVPTLAPREDAVAKQKEKQRVDQEVTQQKLADAEKALQDAEAALAAGKEPLESELLRAPDGTSRVTAAYARRQRGLEQAVAKARTALEKLRAGK